MVPHLEAKQQQERSAMAQPETRTKVVVRKLPPFLKQEGFFNALNKGFEGTYDWSAYYPGKLSHQRLVHSRAYVNFKNPEAVFDFYEVFNGHVFVNEKGAQFRAEVEYAPYQKIPKGRNKKDLREGTIFEDADYLAFLEDLERPKGSVSATDAQKEEADKAAAKGPIITPLIEFIRQKRANKAAAVREKVGPRISARDAPRKAVSSSGAIPKNARKSDKGVLDVKPTGWEDAASRKSSTEWKSKRESTSASEPDKHASSSRPSPRDGVGILKRPATTQKETSSERKRETTSQGGPDKRIVKGALASIIGGGLGRLPRNSDVRKESGVRSTTPIEPSGWGDIPRDDATKPEEADPSSMQNGRSSRNSRRGKPKSTAGSSERNSQPTGWDEESEGLLKKQENIEEKSSSFAGESQRVTILQRKSEGTQIDASSDNTTETNSQTPRPRKRGQQSAGNRGAHRSSDARSSDGADASQVDGAPLENDQKQTRRGRGQQMAGNQTPRQTEEATPRDAGRGSRRRGQGPAQMRNQESDPAAASAKASGPAPQTVTSSTPELTSSGATWQPRLSPELTSSGATRQPRASAELKSSGATWQPRAQSLQPQIRTVQRSAGSPVTNLQSENAISGSLEALSLQERKRQLRHQGPYQPKRGPRTQEGTNVGGSPENALEAVRREENAGAIADAKKRMWVAVQKPG